MTRLDSGGRRTCSTSNYVDRDGVEGGRWCRVLLWELYWILIKPYSSLCMVTMYKMYKRTFVAVCYTCVVVFLFMKQKACKGLMDSCLVVYVAV